ncbi:MAG: S41 family peptidase [Rhodospirillaceae bacterium]
MARVLRDFSLRNWAAVVTTALLLVGGCAADTASLAASVPEPMVEQVFAIGFNRIAEVYLQPVDMAKLGLDGLSGLRTIDPVLKVERVGGAVQIMRGSRLVGEFSAPPGDDPGAWAMVTTRAVERARQFSPPLHDATNDQLYQAVFDGVIADLDGYSRYTTPQRAGYERGVREGYGGIGLVVDLVGDRHTVQEVTRASPADRVGIQVGDVLETIDGAPVARLSAKEVQDILRGPPGSVVKLTVQSGRGSARHYAVHRERVIPNTVQLRVENGIAILKVERFNAATTTNLRDAIGKAWQSLGNRPTGFVLDLRGNPGGLLDQAVAVSSLFIRRGRIVSTAGRHPDSWQRFDAIGEDLLHERPLIVLVDGRSASASEIVAAALQDSGRGVVVGSSSFGKGSVQTVTRLPNDGELFLTWSRLYAPSGHTLHRQGVQPTICTSNVEGSADAVLTPLRTGQTESGDALARLRQAAPEDETALARLRQVCPWHAHEPELDIAVAERLLTVPPLYRSALALSTTAVAER